MFLGMTLTCNVPCTLKPRYTYVYNCLRPVNEYWEDYVQDHTTGGLSMGPRDHTNGGLSMIPPLGSTPYLG